MKRNNLNKQRRKEKRQEDKRDKPKHAPYVRCPTNNAADFAEIDDDEKRDHLNLLLGDWNANG